MFFNQSKIKLCYFSPKNEFVVIYGHRFIRCPTKKKKKKKILTNLRGESHPVFWAGKKNQGNDCEWKKGNNHSYSTQVPS
jgi:hypothetical protein